MHIVKKLNYLGKAFSNAGHMNSIVLRHPRNLWCNIIIVHSSCSQKVCNSYQKVFFLLTLLVLLYCTCA